MSKGKKILTMLGEVVAELVITLLFFGVGGLVLALFGVDFTAEDMDPDLTILIGIGALLVLGFAVAWVIRGIKKARGKKDEE